MTNKNDNGQKPFCPVLNNKFGQIPVLSRPIYKYMCWTGQKRTVCTVVCATAYAHTSTTLYFPFYRKDKN